jgi:hypothetical protein
MNTAYQYILLRFVPDSLAGECLNVGVFMFQKRTNWFRAKISTRLGRITKVYHNANLDEIRLVGKALERYANGLGKRWEETDPDFDISAGLESFIYTVYQKNNNHLQWSEVSAFLGEEDAEEEFAKLYERVIGRFEAEPGVNKSLEAEKAARKPYFRYFDELGISRKLRPHEVPAHNTKVKFEYAWQNGVWHAYEELPMTLIRKESAQDRINGWVGKIKLLSHEHTLMKIHFLTPEHAHTDLLELAQLQLSGRVNGMEISVVTPAEAAAFAQRVKQEMEASENA